MKRIFAVALMFLIFAALVPAVRADTGLIDEIAKSTGLLTSDRGNCTGWVARSSQRRSDIRYDYPYWETLVATAWHCTRTGETYRFGLDRKAEFAGIEGLSAEWDVALLTFRGKKELPALRVGDSPSVGDMVVLYGYGRRVPLPKVGKVIEWDNGLFAVDNTASVGNSGGPVVSVSTGLVVGIGLKNTIKRPEYGDSAIYCLIVNCPVIPPYWAVPANKLLGLARWKP